MFLVQEEPPARPPPERALRAPGRRAFLQRKRRLAGSFACDPCQSLFGAAKARLADGLRWLVGRRPPKEFNIGVTIGKIQGQRLVGGRVGGVGGRWRRAGGRAREGGNWEGLPGA